MIEPEIGKRYYYRPLGNDSNEVAFGKVLALDRTHEAFVTKYYGTMREFSCKYIVAKYHKPWWRFW